MVRTCPGSLSQQGQALLEFSLVAPALIILLLAALQTVEIARYDLALNMVARHAARAASIRADPVAAGRGAAKDLGLPVDRLRFSVQQSLWNSRVQVILDVPTHSWLRSWFPAHTRLVAEASMARQRLNLP
ncbi:MAG: pilus assembly protein [Firmicutes bacterium]|nr:pilus assembly protein [Bacillota bacterium]